MFDPVVSAQEEQHATSTNDVPLQDAETVQTAASVDRKDVENLTDNIGGAEAPPAPRQRKKKQSCRFFATKKGCRAGEACPFVHDRSNVDVQKPSSTAESASTAQVDSKRAEKIDVVVAARNMEPPIRPQQVKDSKTFQVNQIARRFRARQETSESGMILLHFGMPPSDPDFPFDIDALECTLKIPAGFPTERNPTLRVTNKEMERGYQVNVERGFDAIWSQAANPTLLNAMKMLDKRLEVLLTAQKAEIVRLVANAGKPIPAPSPKPETSQPQQQKADASPKTPMVSAAPVKPFISSERRIQAQKKRETEVDILEHRLGRNPQFSKAAEGTLFTVPIEPRKRTELPQSLQAVKAIQLLVPPEYDVEPCSVELLGCDEDAASNVSKAFLKRVEENPDATLLGHINYLAQNMHLMAVAAPSTKIESKPDLEPEKAEEQAVDQRSNETKEPDAQWTRDTDREHVKIIQRPPEWDVKPNQEEEDESTDGYDSEHEFSDEDEDHKDIEGEQGADDTTEASSAPREKGILVSFPDLQLHSIELLELVLVNLTVKCERCKDTADIARVKPHLEEDQTPTTVSSEVHSTSCKKCANPFSVGYRKDILHAHSIRAGYLDLEGCTVVDLLPSTFVPTCADCSTPATANGGVVSVRGESSLAICRSCHGKMSFRIPEVKFLHIGPAALHALPLRSSRKPKKESLGIVAGTQLPGRGRCAHYSKSYRWFRFGCCNAVYACDRCHDKATDHPNEFANRMICGWCSREQHYRPEDCVHCHKDVTGRSGSGFWEGGKGTRERARMSRKDPRKYKRRGGGAVAARSK